MFKEIRVNEGILGVITVKNSSSRRDFLKTVGLGTASLSFTSCRWLGLLPSASRKRLPNFVVIFIDDLGYSDVGCYGAKGFETPNIDHMAAKGIHFTNFYVSQAVCSASRASLLTGCYPNRVSIFGALNPHSKVGLNSNEETIAEILKKKGYATGIFGKMGIFSGVLSNNYNFIESQAKV